MIISLLILTYIPLSQFWLILMTQGLLLGLSTAFAIQPALTVVGQHFKEKRALVMSVVCTGSSLGGIGFPLMFNKLVPRVGFPNALRLAGLKIFMCYSIALFLSTSKPSDKAESKIRAPLVDFGGFRDCRYAVLCVGVWFAILGLWVPAFYISELKTLTEKSAMYFLTRHRNIHDCYLWKQHYKPVLSLHDEWFQYHRRNMVCPALYEDMPKLTFSSAGFVGDRIGRLNLLWPMVMASGLLCLFLWLLSTSIPTLVLFVTMYGFFSSSVTALPPSIIGQITPDDKLGARIGTFYSLLAAASLGGTPVAGALITNAKSRDGYRWLILFSVSGF